MPLLYDYLIEEFGFTLDSPSIITLVTDKWIVLYDSQYFTLTFFDPINEKETILSEMKQPADLALAPLILDPSIYEAFKENKH